MSLLNSIFEFPFLIVQLPKLYSVWSAIIPELISERYKVTKLIRHVLQLENYLSQVPTREFGGTRPSAMGLCNMVRDMKIFHILQAHLSLALSMEVK